MNILLLLSGYTCKRASWEKGDNITIEKENLKDFFEGNNYLNRLLRNHRVTTICALWDQIGLDEVKKYYNPEVYISLSQNNFQERLKNILGSYEETRTKNREKWFKERNIINNLFSPSERVASQLYGRQVVSQKAIEFINKANYKPDLILMTRYDISCRGGLLVRHPVNISSSIKSFLKQEEDLAKIVLPVFNQLNAGMPDMWFYMNYKGLVYMQSIYDDYIKSITADKSEYRNLLTSGWPFSESFDLSNINDKRQFTNIMLSGKESYSLMRYEDWELPNIHTFLKYFLILKEQKFVIKFSSRFESVFSMFLFGNFKRSFLSSIKEIIFGAKRKIQSKNIFQ